MYHQFRKAGGFYPTWLLKPTLLQWSTHRAMWFGLILEDFKIIYKKTKKNHRLFVYQAIWHYSYARLPWYLILFTPSWIPQQVLPSFDIIYINPFLYFRFVDYVLCDSSGTAVRGWFYIIIFYLIVNGWPETARVDSSGWPDTARVAYLILILVSFVFSPRTSGYEVCSPRFFFIFVPTFNPQPNSTSILACAHLNHTTQNFIGF